MLGLGPILPKGDFSAIGHACPIDLGWQGATGGGKRKKLDLARYLGESASAPVSRGWERPRVTGLRNATLCGASSYPEMGHQGTREMCLPNEREPSFWISGAAWNAAIPCSPRFAGSVPRGKLRHGIGMLCGASSYPEMGPQGTREMCLPSEEDPSFWISGAAWNAAIPCSPRFAGSVLNGMQRSQDGSGL